MKPMMVKPRIIILIDSLVGGGTQQALYDYLRCADHEHLQIRVVALTSFKEVFAERISRHAELKFVHSNPSSAWTLLNPFIWCRLYRLIKDPYVHVLHARLEGALFFGSILARIARIPYFVYTIEASQRQMRWILLRQFLYKNIFLKNSAAIFTGYPEEYRSMDLPAGKMRAYEAALDLDGSAPRPEMIGSEDAFNRARPVLVSVGRLHPDKGHQYAIRFISMIRTTMPSAKLYICGEGDYRGELEKLIIHEKLSEQVHLLGYVPGIDWILKRADAYLAFMTNEPLNLSAARAMAWGLPTLSFRTGLYSHVRIEEAVNGCELPLGDLKLAPDKLRYVLNHIDRDAVRRGARLPSSRDIAEQYDKFYLDLVTEQSVE